MCDVLKVSSSGYYEWLCRKPSARKRANDALAHQVKKIFDLNKSRAGAVRTTKALKDEGELFGRHHVARLMRLIDRLSWATLNFLQECGCHGHLSQHPILFRNISLILWFSSSYGNMGVFPLATT